MSLNTSTKRVKTRRPVTEPSHNLSLLLRLLRSHTTNLRFEVLILRTSKKKPQPSGWDYFFGSGCRTRTRSFYRLIIGSLYLSLHLLIVNYSVKSAAIIHFSRILNAGIVPRLALLAAMFPATLLAFAQADTVTIFGADKRVIRL